MAVKKLKKEEDKSLGKVAVPLVMMELLNTINKAYNAPVMSIAEDSVLQRIRTGIFAIDFATQGGIPRGRWFIAVGKESVFKSSFLYITGGKAQRVCGTCLTGQILEKNFKAVSIVLDEKANEFVKLDKDGGYLAKKYLANSKKNNIYIPEQPIRHKKSFKAYQYTIECSHCDDPDYSIFLLIDSEKNYTQYWAIKCGVVHGRLMLAKAQYSEQVGEIIKEVMSTGRCTMVGVDSVPAVGPKIEDTSSFEDHQMGVQPKLWNKIVRVLTAGLNTPYTYIYDKDGKKVVEVRRPEPILAMIQQWREKIGMMFGNPQTMTAGWGLKYASSITFDLSVGEKIFIGDKKDKNVIGIWFNFVLAKAKTAKPFAHGRFYFNLETLEVDNNMSILEKAIDVGIIKQSGGWYTIGEDRFQGKEKLLAGIHNILPRIGNKLIEANEAT